MALNVEYNGVPAKNMGDEHIGITDASLEFLKKEKIEQDTSYGRVS